MSKPLALFFAVLTVLQLLGISAAVAYRNPWAILLLILTTCLTVGIGMRIKRKTLQKNKK